MARRGALPNFRQIIWRLTCLDRFTRRQLASATLSTPKYEYDIAGQRLLGDQEYAEAGRAANEYSVSLINGNDLRGSATLVSIGDIHGLLTADHVWRFIRKGGAEDHFCMVLGSQMQRFEYPFEECTPIVIGEYSDKHEMEGPDLTFIRLDNILKIGTIKSQKSFYPLDVEKGRMFDQMPYRECMWLIWGAPAEQSRKLVTETGELVRKVTHFSGWSKFREITERSGFDYVTVTVPAGHLAFPTDFGGVSGGGVWIPFRFSEDPGGTVLKPILSLFLAGVAYYQMKEAPSCTALTLHGKRSIYQRTISAVLQNR